MKKSILTFNVTASPPRPIRGIPAEKFRSATVRIRDVFAWFAEHDPRPSRSPEATKERQRIRTKFTAFCGDFVCDEARPYHLAEFIDAQTGLESEWSKKRWATAIVRPFNIATRLGFIERNPFAGIAYSEGGQGRDWSDQEYRDLLRHAKPLFRRLIVWIRFSGMRPGELRKLEWSDIDLNERCVKLPAGKTKAGRERYVPLNNVMLKLLLWLKRNQGAGRKYWTLQPDETHVFLNAFLRPWKTNALTKRIRALRAKAGMSDQVKLHGGRHAFATRAILSGIDLSTLSTLLGHADLHTTLRYVHLSGKARFLQAEMERAVKGGKP